jgi:aminoglycoside phosphotransferase (APT) family kinase protein
MRFDARAREWVEHALGPGHRVVGTRRAQGGVSSVVHRVRVRNGAGRERSYMLRRVPRRDDVPDHVPAAEVLNESYALGRVGGGPIPELVAVDPTGAECGAAALVSTWLPGRPDVAPRDPSSWVRGIAAALDCIPATAGPGVAFGDFTPWFAEGRAAPAWSRVPDAWERVRARLEVALPVGGPPRFLHRDFHPGNVLFRRGGMSGIVDWTQASVGPPEVDVSRARVQIAILAGLGAADEFLRCVAEPSEYDPLWDGLVACEIGPWSHDLLVFNRIGAGLTLSHVRAMFDTFVERADATHL